MDEVAEFLRRHPPFDTLDEAALEAVAERAGVESFAAGAAILDSADARAEHAFVVRDGSVELLIGARLFDVLGEGEMFGFASVLDEEPLGFVARAGAGGTVVLRLPADAIRPVLERPEAVRFVARTLAAGMRLLAGPGAGAESPDAADRPAGELVRAPAVVCAPETAVRDAAARMVEAGATCVVVELGDRLGIVTDRDIRTRVLAEGAGPDAPLSAVMTAPAWTLAADRSGTEALMEMLDRGIRHLPVLDAARGLVGVLDDVDLMASERRAPFRLRGLVARADSVAAVAAAAREVPATLIALHDAGQPVAAIGRTLSALHDSITRRLIELAHAELGAPPVPYTWLATGSYGRREPFPSSDVDCALAWEGGDASPSAGGAGAARSTSSAASADGSETARPTSSPASAGAAEDLSSWMTALAGRVLDGLAACGFALDEHGALASRPLFARSVTGWAEAARRWAEDPDRDRGLMLLSVVVESDPVWGATRVPEALAAAFASAPEREPMLRRLAAAALAERPPTGFLRDFVLHSSGERKGVLDIKRGGLLPIEALARWSGLSAGVTAASTRARLDASKAAGTLSTGDADVLRDAFELVSALRMEHQVEQLRAGRPPDDLIAPKALTSLTRSALKDAFRAVARVQRGIAVELGLRPR
jgi:CBS domain-containing protein